MCVLHDIRTSVTVDYCHLTLFAATLAHKCAENSCPFGIRFNPQTQETAIQILSLSLSLSLSFSLHQLFFSYMSLRYHRISFLKTAVNNVSVPDLSALERTVWNFLATCIELGQLKKRVTWHFVIGWWVGIARDIKKAGCREVCRAFGKSGFSCWRGTWVCPDVSGVV